MNPARLLTGLALLQILGCSDGRVVGNSSETENTLTAQSLPVDSLLPAWNRPVASATVATLRLDASNFDFSRSDSVGSTVAVERQDGTPIPFERVFWDKLSARARLRIRIDTPLLAKGARIVLACARPSAERSDPAAVWSALPDSQKLALASVHVDDFEGGSMQNLLPLPHTWYRGMSDSAKVNWFTLGSAGAGRSGNAIGIGYSASYLTGRYALIGTELGSGPCSLRSLDSLVAWVRGSGTLAIAFDNLTGAGNKKAWKRFQLDTAWRRVRVRPEDLDTADGIGGNIGWANVRDSVTNLTFLVMGGSEVWIDDVRLHGIDRDDLR